MLKILTKWFKSRSGAVRACESRNLMRLEDLLFRVEIAESASEQAALTREIDALAAEDEEVAKMYSLHCLLERELRLLVANGGCFPTPESGSFFRRLWHRIRPGSGG